MIDRTKLEIPISLRCLDGSIDSVVRCPITTTVAQLKNLIRDVSPKHPPPSSQKLVFCGKILVDADVLLSILSSVEAPELGVAIHLVVPHAYLPSSPLTPPVPSQPSPSINNATPTSSAFLPGVPTMSPVMNPMMPMSAGMGMPSLSPQQLQLYQYQQQMQYQMMMQAQSMVMARSVTTPPEGMPSAMFPSSPLMSNGTSPLLPTSPSTMAHMMALAQAQASLSHATTVHHMRVSQSPMMHPTTVPFPLSPQTPTSSPSHANVNNNGTNTNSVVIEQHVENDGVAPV